MEHTPGNGLSRPDLTQVAQEHMNNATALAQKQAVPAQTLTKLSCRWRMDIEQHYERLKKRVPSLRQDALADTLGARRDGAAKYCLLPDRFPAGRKQALPEEWANKDVSKEDFRIFLSQMCGVSESFLRNKLFPDRKRSSKQYVDEVFQRLDLSPEEGKNLSLYRSFGWWPEGVDLDDRRKYLKEQFRNKWGSISWDQASEYLMLSGSTMDNIRTRVNLHTSTAYRFIIALGDPNDPSQQLKLYHQFQLHPIVYELDQATIYGEADGIVTVTMAVFDSLFSKMGSTEFWSTLRTLLIFYDNRFSLSLCGQLFYQDNELLYDADLPGRKE